MFVSEEEKNHEEHLHSDFEKLVFDTVLHRKAPKKWKTNKSTLNFDLLLSKLSDKKYLKFIYSFYDFCFFLEKKTKKNHQFLSVNFLSRATVLIFFLMYAIDVLSFKF